MFAPSQEPANRYLPGKSLLTDPRAEATLDCSLHSPSCRSNTLVQVYAQWQLYLEV